MPTTEPANYAWASIERSLEFSAALSAVVIDDDTHTKGSGAEPFNGATRLNNVLTVLKDFSSVRLATLWKLKARPQQASLIASSRPFDEALDPTDPKNHVEFSCSLTNSDIGRIYQKYLDEREEKAELQPGASPPWTVHIEDLKDVIASEQNNTTHNRINKMHLKRLLAIPFGSLCTPNGNAQEGQSNAPESHNYLLNLYFDEPLAGDNSNRIPDEMLNAVIAKLKSGVCALIDRRLTRITSHMTALGLSRARDGARSAMRQAVTSVLPRYIWCEQNIRLNLQADGNYTQEMNVKIDSKECEVLEDVVGHLAPADIGALVELSESLFTEKDKAECLDERRADVVLAAGNELNPLTKLDKFSHISSIMIGRILNHTNHDHPIGYLFLINRLNDMAILKNKCARVPDYFDWEDEIYLNHTCTILGFIAELFMAEEARLNRTHIIAHDLHAPTGFVYATIERLQDWAKRDVDWHGMRATAKPKGMVMKELDDILVHSDLQSALIDSLMIGISASDTPPAERYFPNRINLQNVADDIKRITIPLCAKIGLPPNRVQIVNFPHVVMDMRAAKQVFMNITTNAVKYSDKNDKDSFSVLVSSEDINLEELKTTNAPGEFIERLESLGVERGLLISFEDNGIGIAKEDRERIFHAGVRAQREEVMEMIGAGLGLSEVKSIMKDHFGDVWVETLHKPTRICLFFPDFIKTGSYTSLKQWTGKANECSQ